MILRTQFSQTLISLRLLFLFVIVVYGYPVQEDEVGNKPNPPIEEIQKMLATYLERMYKGRESIDDYYARRKAVMEKYRDRQRKINETRDKLSEETMKNVNYKRNVDPDSSFHPNSNSLLYHFDDNAIGEKSNSRRRGDVTINPTAVAETTAKAEVEGNEDTKKFSIGRCRGFVINQHNIKITGPSPPSAEQLLNINVQGFCIACIEVLPQNNRKPNLTITSGGPGSNHVAVDFNINSREDCDFTVKVWGSSGECSANSLQ